MSIHLLRWHDSNDRFQCTCGFIPNDSEPWPAVVRDFEQHKYNQSNKEE